MQFKQGYLILVMVGLFSWVQVMGKTEEEHREPQVQKKPPSKAPSTPQQQSRILQNTMKEISQLPETAEKREKWMDVMADSFTGRDKGKNPIYPRKTYAVHMKPEYHEEIPDLHSERQAHLKVDPSSRLVRHRSCPFLPAISVKEKGAVQKLTQFFTQEFDSLFNTKPKPSSKKVAPKHFQYKTPFPTGCVSAWLKYYQYGHYHTLAYMLHLYFASSNRLFRETFPIPDLLPVKCTLATGDLMQANYAKLIKAFDQVIVSYAEYKEEMMKKMKALDRKGQASSMEESILLASISAPGSSTIQPPTVASSSLGST